MAAAMLLAAAATACGWSGSGGHAGARPAGSVTTGTGRRPPALPTSFPTSLKDLKKWEKAYRDGGWRNWDRSTWLRRAADFVNPIIDGLWSDKRMKAAGQGGKGVSTGIDADRGWTDPAPAPVRARPVATPYHDSAPGVGKLFFDGPEGSMACSATVVQDPAHPGRSDLVWTAGHCVHAGESGGWYRNVAFVPSYDDKGLDTAALKGAPRDVLAPYGVWWADGASTSDEWIASGSPSGGGGSAYDFAVLHVTPEEGTGGRSLEETVGAAVPVWFDAPPVTRIGAVGAWGYPVAAPFDGQRMYACVGRPGRLSVAADAPAEYRIGCTMTGGSSGGGWFTTRPDGKRALVSNTSIGPATNTWLAGPRLGAEAEKMLDGMSRKFS
ncbi:trypsin-like serine peptidase [Actinacidiphila sp. ITFR-21]|uniref:trypsin-like serine peptidase n=1 Tax=Actinacidiphila sp. ITFR-21 TaxID=3075199 RepID=UPI00288AF016|nr:hypothetical protein [Streptomyces sp. ITFR-21]WNI18389.1 hypothetical protein RLT57_24540 [Streptomyces sp. ITFR-21]